MRPYFEKMPEFGKPLKEDRIARAQDSRASLVAVEDEIAAARKAIEDVGLPTAEINKRGSLTVWQRIEYLVEPGTWHPLHSLYNPADNPEGTTNVVDGLGKVGGRWAVVIGFDNKWLAGAWVPGQSENILRVTNLSRRLNIPLVWLVNCSGVQLPEQEKFYADRRGSGTCFFRHAELEQAGIPVLAGIYGTNPAGGGYQGISSTILLAHKDANIAVGGVGIVSGMAPRGGFDVEGLEELIARTRDIKERPAGPRRKRITATPASSRTSTTRRRACSTASGSTCARFRPTTRCSSASRSLRSPGCAPTTSTTCCPSIRRRPTRSTTSSPASSTAASTWSSGPTTAPRSTPGW